MTRSCHGLAPLHQLVVEARRTGLAEERARLSPPRVLLPHTYTQMILLLLFLQKQSLAFAVYLFGIGTLHTGPGLKKKTHVIMLAGSATVDLQQHVWVTMQAVRARYPEAQGIVGGERERIRERIRKSRRVLQRKRDSHEESRRPISSMRCCNEGNTNFPVDTVLDRCQHGQRSKT